MAKASFAGKNIVVTGAGEGIGKELTKRLHDLGATVYAVSLELAPLEVLKQTYPNLKIAAFDLGNWNTTKAELTKLIGNAKIHGLVNNAGITIVKPFEQFTEQEYDKVMNINAKATFNVTQTVLPHIVDGGSIVSLSSLAGLSAFADHTVYACSKAAVDALSRGLSLELGPRNIRVNTVCPTAVLTAMGRLAWSDPAKANGLKSKIPLNRFGEVREVIDPIVFLLSEQSSFINGHHLPIEGGFSAC